MANAFNRNPENSTQNPMDLTDPRLIKRLKAMSNRYYGMGGDKLLIILNHHTFRNTSRFQPPIRKYTHKDVKRLTEEFSKLGFKIILLQDFTYQKIIKNLTAIGARDHTNTSCVCLAILTHGADGGMLCAADRLYPLSEVMAIFETKSLANKPKIFLVQACRGDKRDGGYYLEIDRHTSLHWLPACLAKVANFFYCFFMAEDTDDEKSRVPSHADTFVVLSSIKGNTSLDGDHGTPMVQELCNTLHTYKNNLHFADMITVMQRAVADSNQGMPIPETSNTARLFLTFKSI